MAKGKSQKPSRQQDTGQEQETSSNNEESSEYESSHEEDPGDEDEEVDEAQAIDGLSSVISKIVNQKVTRDVPILEKRKTTNVQKEDKDEGAPKKKKKRTLAAEPEDEATKQARALAALTKERNLKKIATKGVVALFNAIMESKKKREEEDEDGGDKYDSGKGSNSKKKKEINDSVKKLTKSKFLNLLTGKETGAEDARKKENNDTAKVGGSKGWDVLKDDAEFHESNQLLLRDWDKDEED